MALKIRFFLASCLGMAIVLSIVNTSCGKSKNFPYNSLEILWNNNVIPVIVSFLNNYMPFKGMPGSTEKHMPYNGIPGLQEKKNVFIHGDHFEDRCSGTKVKHSCNSVSWCYQVLHRDTSSCTLICNCAYYRWFAVVIVLICAIVVVVIGCCCYACFH